LSKKKDPSFLIHLTGTGCISDERENTWEGKYNPKVWSDIDDIEAIYSLPDEAQHRVIDRAIQDASNDLIKTAVICPPDIYGKNTGVGNRNTFLVPDYVEVLLRTKEAFYLGDGDNIRAVTHISDVVDLFLILLEQALRGGGDAQWGRDVCMIHYFVKVWY
jgi:nucleoside-diphosphate-sugar epimerase